MLSMRNMLAKLRVRHPPKSNIQVEEVHLALGNDFYFAGGSEYKQWQAARIVEIKAELNPSKLKLWLKHPNGYLREAGRAQVPSATLTLFNKQGVFHGEEL